MQRLRGVATVNSEAGCERAERLQAALGEHERALQSTREELGELQRRVQQQHEVLRSKMAEVARLAAKILEHQKRRAR